MCQIIDIGSGISIGNVGQPDILVPLVAIYYKTSVSHSYRRCLLGFACDFYVHDTNSGACVFLPFLPIKSFGIHDIVEIASGHIGYLLHCSGSQENMVVNSDMSTYSEERKRFKKKALFHDV